jgi:DNA repair protein RadC
MLLKVVAIKACFAVQFHGKRNSLVFIYSEGSVKVYSSSGQYRSNQRDATKRGKSMNDSPKPVYRITDLATDERPRERLEHLGPQVLATSELLAILLRVGVPGENAVQVGQRLLKEFGGITGLHRAPFDELCNQHGIGKAKAAQIKAALELAHRFSLKPEERPAVNSPADAAALVDYEMSVLEQEHLRVILLDTRNHVLEVVEIYKGSVNSSQIHVGEIFKAAIRRNAPALIVVHNHPSGAPRSM